MREVGILIVAKDAAGAVFNKVGSAARAMSEKAKASFESFKNSIRFFNDAIQVGEKIFRVFDRAIGDAVRRSMEFRFSNDASRIAIEALSKEVLTTQARIGDLLVPAIAGIAKAFTPAIKELRKFITENEKLIQLGIIEWAVKVGTAIAQGIGGAVSIVLKIYHGWGMLIATVTALGHKQNAVLLHGVELVLQLARASEERLKSVRDAREEQERAADVAAGAAAQAMSDMAAQTSAVDKFQETLISTITKAGELGKTLVGTAVRGTEATKDLESAWKAAAESANAAWEENERDFIEGIRKQVGEHAQGIATMLANHTRMLERKADLQEADAKRFEEYQDAQKQKAREFAEDAGSAVSGIFTPILVGAKSASQAWEEMLANMRDRIVSFLIEKAIVGFFSLVAGLFSGGTSSLLGGLFSLSKISFGGGGMVHRAAGGMYVGGGTPGIDSVPIIAMPHERVLSPAQNAAYERSMMMGSPASSATTRGGDVHVHANVGLSVPTNQQETDRWVRDSLMPSLQRLGRLGIKT